MGFSLGLLERIGTASKYALFSSEKGAPEGWYSKKNEKLLPPPEENIKYAILSALEKQPGLSQFRLLRSVSSPFKGKFVHQYAVNSLLFQGLVKSSGEFRVGKKLFVSEKGKKLLKMLRNPESAPEALKGLRSSRKSEERNLRDVLKVFDTRLLPAISVFRLKSRESDLSVSKISKRLGIHPNFVGGLLNQNKEPLGGVSMKTIRNALPLLTDEERRILFASSIGKQVGEKRRAEFADFAGKMLEREKLASVLKGRAEILEKKNR